MYTEKLCQYTQNTGHRWTQWFDFKNIYMNLSTWKTPWKYYPILQKLTSFRYSGRWPSSRLDLLVGFREVLRVNKFTPKLFCRHFLAESRSWGKNWLQYEIISFDSVGGVWFQYGVSWKKSNRPQFSANIYDPGNQVEMTVPDHIVLLQGDCFTTCSSISKTFSRNIWPISFIFWYFSVKISID